MMEPDEPASPRTAEDSVDLGPVLELVRQRPQADPLRIVVEGLGERCPRERYDALLPVLLRLALASREGK